MAKYDEREGNSCHLHMSLRGTDGVDRLRRRQWRGGRPGDRSPVFASFVAGVLATLRDFTLLYAPTINSYKRYQPGSFAPTAVAWGEDNRTCALRVVGHGSGLRVENRVPGGDVNPYLAQAAMLAGGLHGVRNELELEPAFVGNAYAADFARVPSHAARGPRPVRRVRGGGGRVRQGRRGALPAGRGRRAGGVRGGRDGLGAPAGVRAVLIGHVTMTLHSVVDPATEDVVTEVESLDVAQVDAAVARAVAAGPAWRAVAPADRARLLRRFAAVGRRPRRRAGRPGGAGRRPHRRQRPVGGRQRPRRARLLRRGAGAAVRPADPGRRRARRDVPRAARRRRDHRAVELPHADRRLGLRPGAGGRQHGRAEARRAHPADGPAAGRAGAGGRPARRRVHGPARQGLGGRGAAGHPRAGPQDRLHRLDRGRDRDPAAGRRPGQTGHARARRQVGEHRLRRRGRREGGGERPGRRLRQRRPGLLRPLADPGPAPGVRPLPRAAGAGGHRVCGSDRRPSRTRRWAR